MEEVETLYQDFNNPVCIYRNNDTLYTHNKTDRQIENYTYLYVYLIMILTC